MQKIMEQLPTSPADDSAAIESFAPDWEVVDNEFLLPAILESTPDISDTTSAALYQEAFTEYFGYAPVPIIQEAIVWGDTDTRNQPQLWMFVSDSEERQAVISSNPAATAVLAEMGFDGLDAYQRRGVFTKPFVASKYSTSLDEHQTGASELVEVCYASDGYITYDTKFATPNIDRALLQELADESTVNVSPTEVVADMTLEGNNAIKAVTLSKRIENPELRAEFEQYLEDIGVIDLDEGKIQIPTPRKFQERLAERESRGLYNPPFTPIALNRFGSGIYNLALEEGRVPYSTMNINTFMHDIANEHTLTYLMYGNPLFELLAIYAATEKDPDLSGESPNAKTITVNIDRLTDHIVRGNDVRSLNPYQKDWMGCLFEIATAINELGVDNFRDTSVISLAMEQTGIVNKVDLKLDGAKLAKALEILARIPPLKSSGPIAA